jgi:putative endopeptidase
MMLRRTIPIMLAAALATAAGAAPPPQEKAVDTAHQDTTAAACQDFYQFANGGWLAKNPIPGDFPAWGTGVVVSERNRDAVRSILEDSSKNTTAVKGSNDQKIGDYYASCMAEDKIEAAGIKPLESEFAKIDAIKDQKSLQDEIARLQSSGVNAAFQSGSEQDFKDSTQVLAAVVQGGLGLPDRDYYFKTDDKTKGIREAYVKHIAKMLELLGDTPEKAAAGAKSIMALETKMADASMTRVDQRDPAKIYHKMNAAQMKEMAPDIMWADYFKGVGLKTASDVNVAQPEYFKALNGLYKSVSIDDWKVYLRFHLVDSVASALPDKFVQEDFDFKGRTLLGTKDLQARWKRCTRSTDNALGEALGEVYVRKAFPPKAKARAVEMVKNLEAALKDDLTTLPWMSDATRKAAITKLDAFINKIGYPDKWRDYSALNVDRGSYVLNLMRARAFENQRDLNKVGKPVDKTEWGMSPPTVNAYYNPQINEIVFPAGILQPPYFDPNADDASNYGAMGSVIGHEMTHGFDDEGRQFDSTGNFKEWWTDEDKKKFEARAECIVKQFNGYEIEKGIAHNGKLVQGESIADLGGLVVAYAAWQKSLAGKPKPEPTDGYTPEQRFFLAYAFGWATNIRPETARLLVNIDPHPIAKYRVNGPVSNMAAFAQAFGCKEGDPMVRSAADKCVIW